MKTVTKFLVKAVTKTDISTISRLYINGHFECYVLEDVDRGLKQSMPLSILEKMKVQNKTAIPEGTYKLSTSFSNRFQKVMPILIAVPVFDGVRIHAGNYAKDTEGCLLLGTGFTKDMVTDSRMAFESLFPKINDLLSKGEIEITLDRSI
jgi:hypothetical protein